jgi:hypothetical protein
MGMNWYRGSEAELSTFLVVKQFGYMLVNKNKGFIMIAENQRTFSKITHHRASINRRFAAGRISLASNEQGLGSVS